MLWTASDKALSWDCVNGGSLHLRHVDSLLAPALALAALATAVLTLAGLTLAGGKGTGTFVTCASWAFGSRTPPVSEAP